MFLSLDNDKKFDIIILKKIHIIIFLQQKKRPPLEIIKHGPLQHKNA